MNNAEIRTLVSRLRVKVYPFRKLKNLQGPRGGLERLRHHVTALLVNERLEMYENNAYLTRQYTECLLQRTLDNGIKHADTRKMLDWWITDAAAMHKLVNVLVPRFKDTTRSYTRLLKAPMLFDPTDVLNPMAGMAHKKVMLELRGNPFPPLSYPNSRPNRNHLHNVLLEAARRDKRFALLNEQQIKEEMLETEEIVEEVD